MTSDPELLKTALQAADAAAEVHRRYSGRIHEYDVRRKGRADFVSRVDLEAQDAALSVIRERHPSHEILSEEGEAAGYESPDLSDGDRPVWIVDPLDGTTNFLHGHPAYAASVGVWIAGKGVAGAVVAPATDERWWALLGGGAFKNGEPIHTSSLRDLSTALVGTGFPFKHPGETARYLEEFSRVLESTAGIRRGGSAALDLCYLAQGSLDVFWEGTLAPWDVAAGVVILGEAGGIATRRDGRPLAAFASGTVVAANAPEMHEAMRTLLDGA